ncbi:MAG TPA: cytochrome P450 [Gaiellales bacterium]|nr:cytochrome P450 [Gaiellales bacterium]
MSRADATIDASGIRYDPLDLEGDPYPTYRRLRAAAPVYAGVTHGVPFWAVPRFDDVQAVARDWETFSSGDGNDLDDTGLLFGAEGELTSADPPLHTRLRAAVKNEFGTGAVRMRLEQTVRDTTRKLIAGLREHEVVDVARDLAYPLPAAVMCGWLGFPAGDHAGLARWHALMVERRPGRIGLTDEGLRAGEEMRAYVREALRRPRTHEADDLLSLLAAANAAGVLTEDEAVGGAMLLFVAGISTTSALISNAFLHLHRFGNELRLLRRSPELIPQAIEELLRFDSPFQWFTRVAANDTEIHGVRIPAGGRVVLVWGSANRDDRRWPQPDELVVRRERHRHVAFGEGIHHCLGAPLARMEARIVLEQILPVLVDYQPTGVVERRFTPSERTIVSLPLTVRWRR